MPMIRETIVTTLKADGSVHMVPLGLIADGAGWIIAPFRPSPTLDNLEATPFAAASHVEDVRIFAGLLTGRRDWPLLPSEHIPVPRLADATSHLELAVTHRSEDAQRPRLHCRVLAETAHRPFGGHNRAKLAVIELAILSTRLTMLPREKVESEMAYLAIAVQKTAGPEESEAWEWLARKIAGHYAGQAGSNVITHSSNSKTVEVQTPK